MGGNEGRNPGVLRARRVELDFPPVWMILLCHNPQKKWEAALSAPPGFQEISVFTHPSWLWTVWSPTSHQGRLGGREKSMSGWGLSGTLSPMHWNSSLCDKRDKMQVKEWESALSVPPELTGFLGSLYLHTFCGYKQCGALHPTGEGWEGGKNPLVFWLLLGALSAVSTW